jgi:hypothetical protein
MPSAYHFRARTGAFDGPGAEGEGGWSTWGETTASGPCIGTVCGSRRRCGVYFSPDPRRSEEIPHAGSRPGAPLPNDIGELSRAAAPGLARSTRYTSRAPSRPPCPDRQNKHGTRLPCSADRNARGPVFLPATAKAPGLSKSRPAARPYAGARGSLNPSAEVFLE